MQYAFDYDNVSMRRNRRQYFARSLIADDAATIDEFRRYWGFDTNIDSGC